MTIDIYEQGALTYNARKAIRNVSLTPTVAGITIKRFDYGNGSDSSVILDATPNITPEQIRYIVLKNGNKTPQHYYVTGFQFISQNRYQLSLLRNAWFGVNKHKNAYIKRSNYIPSSVLMNAPEKGLEFNKIKSNEIVVEDQYGRGPWGFLYLNKTESDLSVALNNIDYNISGTEIPISPDEPVQQPDDSYLAYYNDYAILNQPTPPSEISVGSAYLYKEDTVDVSNTTMVPDMTNKITQPTKTNLTTLYKTEAFFGASMVLYSAYRSKTYPGYYLGYAGIVSDDATFTINESGQIVVCTGTIKIAQKTADSSSNSAYKKSDPWESCVRGSTSSNGASGTLRTGILSCKKMLNSDDVVLSAVHNLSDYLVGAYIQGLTPANIPLPNAVPAGKTVTTVPSNKIYRTTVTPASYHNYTFPTTPATSEVSSSGNLPVGTNSGVNTTTTVAFRASKTTDTNNHIYPVLGWLRKDTSTYNTINSVQGSRVFPVTTTRSKYEQATINANQVVCTNKITEDVFQDQSLTTAFIQSNLPADAKFWGISRVATYANPGIAMPTAGAFTNNGVSQEFSYDNTIYRYKKESDQAGFYRVGQDVYEVTQETLTRQVTAPLEYTVNVKSYETNTFGLVGGNTTVIGTALADMYVTHLGTPKKIDTIVECVLDKSIINKSTIINEPYAILALPLFALKYSLDGVTVKESNLLDSQKIFYDMIRTYSGTGQIADAQVFPYAPEIFKQYYNNDANGVWVNMQQMNKIGKQAGGDDLNSMPFVVLDNSNINFSYYFNSNPYPDKRKEVTLRKMRLASPNFDSIFEYNYYDFNNEITNWGPQNNNADSRIDVDITLKPFNIYMHACPYIRDNTLMGSRDFDDLRGLVCGSALYESTLTSSAFETYKRQNTMYEQIQQRTVDSMNINLDVERTNEKYAGILGTLQATAMGALSGGAMADYSILGNNASGVGATIGGAAAGIASAAAYTAQYKANEKLRSRELADQKFYYEANIANIKAQPDSLNRVSSFNQDILNRFGIIIEVYSCTAEEAAIYDRQITAFGHTINITDDLYNHLINGQYIEGMLITSEEPPHIHQRLDEDLRKGVYYYEQI